MARSKKNNERVYSSISDECLSQLLERDFNRAPSEFVASPSSNDIHDAKEFLRNTSARGINPIKKWL